MANLTTFWQNKTADEKKNIEHACDVDNLIIQTHISWFIFCYSLERNNQIISCKMNEERNKMIGNVPSDLSIVRFSSVRAQEIVALTKMIGEDFCTFCISIC